MVGACAASWPTASYVSNVTEGSDVDVLASSIADYVAGALPPGSSVAVEPAQPGNTIAPQLDAALARDGLQQDPRGHRVQYIAEPLDEGIMLRVSIDNDQGATCYFTHAGSFLQAGGPMMVASP